MKNSQTEKSIHEIVYILEDIERRLQNVEEGLNQLEAAFDIYIEKERVTDDGN